MKFKHILITFGTLLILSSCKKFVVDISPEYEGEWHSAPVTGSDGIDREMYFIIDGNQATSESLSETLCLIRLQRRKTSALH